MDTFPVHFRRPFDRIQQHLDEQPRSEGEPLATLLNLYRPYLLAIAQARLDERLRVKVGASDLVQDTLATAHRAWRELPVAPESEEELRVWLRGILLQRLKAMRRRYYRAQSRSLSREVSLDDGESKQLAALLPLDEADTPSALLESELQQERVRQALDRLPPAYRQVILWRNRDGSRFAEIGHRLGRSADAARMLWTRALRLLKSELEGEWE